jgi:D-serine deaminase-like pyridoxal phosphate-dependent protein
MSAGVSVPSLTCLETVPTPALVVDLGAARRNHERAVATLGPGQVLRPHFKAHKSTALAALQLATGAASVCCQTSWEALVLAKAGVRDIMLTNQLVDRAALAELAQAARLAELSTLVDHPRHVALLAETARISGSRIDVLVEVDIGMKRCGVVPGSDDLPALAAKISEAPGLRFLGIQAYDGQVAAIKDPAARRQAAEGSAALTRQAVERMLAAGFEVPIVAGGSTGHLPFMRDLPVWTDIQAGSYLLMDGVYRECPDLDYEVALFALATVIHRSAERAVLDIGLKHLAVDRGNPAWIGDPGTALRLSDEHTVLALPPHSGLAVGDRTFILPRHVDPTVNLHPALWLLDGDRVTPSPIDARMSLRDVVPAVAVE